MQLSLNFRNGEGQQAHRFITKDAPLKVEADLKADAKRMHAGVPEGA